MLSPAFRNHTGDSSADTTISHQLPGACHYATFFTKAAFSGHRGTPRGPGSDFFPTGKAPSSKGCDPRLCVCVCVYVCGGGRGLGARSLEKVTEADGDAERLQILG